MYGYNGNGIEIRGNQGDDGPSAVNIYIDVKKNE